MRTIMVSLIGILLAFTGCVTQPATTTKTTSPPLPPAASQAKSKAASSPVKAAEPTGTATGGSVVTAAALIRTNPLHTVTLAWDHSPDSDVINYFIHQGVASADYTNKITVGYVNTVTVSNLVEGVTYFFAATAYNSSELESEKSNEVSYTVPTTKYPPLPPGNLILTPLTTDLSTPWQPFAAWPPVQLNTDGAGGPVFLSVQVTKD